MTSNAVADRSTSIKCGKCKGHHESIDQVRQCFDNGNYTNWSATPGQTDFVRFLVNDRVMDDQLVSKANRMLARGLTFGEASKMIDYMKALPSKGKAFSRKPAVGEGMYKMGRRIYRVQVAVNGSGYLYAKVLIPPNQTGGKPRFRRDSSALYKLRPEHAMTKEQAAEFGALYGFCVVCGRTLTDEGSIEAGIGPICASKNGWA